MGGGLIPNLSLLDEFSRSLCMFKVGEHILVVYQKLGTENKQPY